MKLKIISKGTPKTTKVLDENGEEIENVFRVDWSVDAKTQLASAIIHVYHVEVGLKTKKGGIRAVEPGN